MTACFRSFSTTSSHQQTKFRSWPVLLPIGKCRRGAAKAIERLFHVVPSADRSIPVQERDGSIGSLFSRQKDVCQIAKPYHLARGKHSGRKLARHSLTQQRIEFHTAAGLIQERRGGLPACRNEDQVTVDLPAAAGYVPSVGIDTAQACRADRRVFR